jgi:V8-like Glu-specific endopeptidase
MKLIPFLIFILTQSSYAVQILGTDDRQDIFEVQDQRIRELSKSIVALIPKNRLIKIDNSTYELVGSSLKENYKLCDDEKFSDESLIANCSASLIKKDIILTAAHCVTKDSESSKHYLKESYYAVFNYYKKNKNQKKFYVHRDDVYELKKEVYHLFDFSKDRDLALYQLDRVAVDKKPLNFDLNYRPHKGDELYMLGFPFGISMKYASNGQVTKVDGKMNFHHNLDAFSVNSGSAIFKQGTDTIVAVLTAGTGRNIQNFGALM